MKFIFFFTIAAVGFVLPTAIAQAAETGATVYFCSDSNCNNILDDTPVIIYPGGCNISVQIPSGAVSSQISGLSAPSSTVIMGFYADPGCGNEDPVILLGVDDCVGMQIPQAGPATCAMMTCTN